MLFYFNKKIGGDFLKDIENKKSVSQNIDDNISYLENLFENCGDIVKRKFPVGVNKDIWLYVIYVDDMVSRELIESRVIDTLMIEIKKTPPDENNFNYNLFKELVDGGITTADIKEIDNLDDACTEILAGNTLLLIDGFSKCIIVSTKGFPKRGVSEADTEIVVQGSKEAFAESFRINTVLIRRRIRDTKLKIEQLQVGKRSKTDIGIVYIDDIVRPEILEETKKRIDMIDIDAILDSGYVEQFIEDDYLSPFPQIQLTERPDKAASALLEGRIVIIVDNTPFVLMLPAVLASFYQSAEDYYQRWEIMSFSRIIRYIAGFIAVSLPGLYIATAVYHPSMIPTQLLFKIAASRGDVPIPAVFEVLLMEIAFETLREAGIRLPSAIGSTLGIVGGIIIGQAAVEAGLVSPIVVIIVSLTGLCSFSIPNIALVTGFRLMKYFIIFFSAVLGLFGFWVSMLFILIHLVALKSFGIPFMFPFTSAESSSDMKDTFFRLPIFKMKKRPIFANPNQKIRMKIKENFTERRK